MTEPECDLSPLFCQHPDTQYQPFILLNLSGLADRRHADREIADLLFFPTGGGKTEAYLGLAAFVIAHRRIKGPGLLGAGVAVIALYPASSHPRPAWTRRLRRLCAGIDAPGPGEHR